MSRNNWCNVADIDVKNFLVDYGKYIKDIRQFGSTIPNLTGCHANKDTAIKLAIIPKKETENEFIKQLRQLPAYDSPAYEDPDGFIDQIVEEGISRCLIMEDNLFTNSFITIPKCSKLENNLDILIEFHEGKIQTALTTPSRDFPNPEGIRDIELARINIEKELRKKNGEGEE